MRETKDLEFKEAITNSFLKTVSAFANYGTGQIKFGIKDDGSIVGISDPIAASLNIENKINDSIKPHPDYEINIDDETKVITLTVNKGSNPPYFYKSKAYKRNDSSTIELNSVELSRLILKGRNENFDGLISEQQDLTFSVLESTLKKDLGIEKISEDVLITLDLYKKSEGYTNAGALLADKNQFRGIDMVRFGKNINIMLDRANYEKISILEQYNSAISKYRQYYQHEEIIGSNRKVVSQIPEEAFREAIANALFHRTWDVDSQIKVSMYDDKIEVTSPGGLPAGLSKEEYLNGQISILRNPIIANIFFRLGLIEQFGTGIRRIVDSYENSLVKPQFHTYENSITIVLPVKQISVDELSREENEIYQVLDSGPLSTKEIVNDTSFGRTKALQIINDLIEKGYLEKEGNGRATKYSRK